MPTDPGAPRWPAVEAPTSRLMKELDARPHAAPRPVPPPRVPRAAFDTSTLPPRAAAPGREELRTASDAIRPMRAWLRHGAVQEGKSARVVLGHAAANAVAQALLARPESLPRHLQTAFTTSQAALAARTPGKDLHLSADQADALDTALSAIERRCAARRPSMRPEIDPAPRPRA